MGRFRFTVSTITLVLIVAVVETSQAATFWDWLWGRSPYYQPRHVAAYAAAPAAYPAQVPVANQPVYPGVVPTASGTPCPPAVSNAAPAEQFAGQPCCQPVSQPVQPFVAAYARRPLFRNSWLRVPVTRYRPVAVANPWTGVPTSQIQPCNTYTWQLQRVPTTRYRPVYSWLHGRPGLGRAAARPNPGRCQHSSASPPPRPALVLPAGRRQRRPRRPRPITRREHRSPAPKAVWCRLPPSRRAPAGPRNQPASRLR